MNTYIKDFMYLIMGESGSGKDTVVDMICADPYNAHLGLKKLKSFTTRPKRHEDEDTHYFITEEKFNDIARTDGWAAWTEFDGYKYGAQEIQLMYSQFYIVDPRGAMSVLEYFSNGNRRTRYVRTIYLTADEDIRADRLRARGHDEEYVQRRLAHDREAFKGIDLLYPTRIDTGIYSPQMIAEGFRGVMPVKTYA